MTTPVSHLREGLELSADALVDLYKITLRNDAIVYRFKADDTVTWQGQTWEGIALQMTGDTRSAEGEESRPALKLFNPMGIFNSVAISGKLDLATVQRRTVLRRHIDADTNIYQQRLWYVGRVAELISGQSVTLELRNMTEGPTFQVPVRMYIPPEFPRVTL